jgi:hypothetical protein
MACKIREFGHSFLAPGGKKQVKTYGSNEEKKSKTKHGHPAGYRANTDTDRTGKYGKG